jgi:hypothetical protein
MLFEASTRNMVVKRSVRRTDWTSASASTISVITAARNRIASARRIGPSPARLRALAQTSGGRINGIRISHQGLPTVTDQLPSVIA